MRYLRDLGRRPVRTVLTILGTAEAVRGVDGVDVVVPAVMTLMDDQARPSRWASRP